MKVFYDISFLEIGVRNPSGRTGIFRVVENVAFGLAKSNDCDLVLYAGKSENKIEACAEYIGSNPHLQNVHLIHSKSRALRIFLDDMSKLTLPQLRELITQKDFLNGVQNIKLSRRIVRKFASLAKEGFNRWIMVTDKLMLKHADIYHSPFGALPEQVKEARKLQRFLTVHDMVAILYPNFTTSEHSQFVRRAINSLSASDWVITPSQATKNDLCNYLAFDQDRVFVTPWAASPDLFYKYTDTRRLAQVRLQYNIPPEPYVLSLNTLEPRKNIERVVESFAQLVREQKISDLNLVLAGGKGWLYDGLLKTISTINDLKDRIILTGYVEDENLAALYSGALVFVYPSFYEGFGLPILEAMQCGVPVIASNNSSIPEVLGDAGIMINAMDTDSLCQNIYSLYSNKELRDSFSAKSVNQARQFNWENSIRNTILAYQYALKA